MGQSALFQNCKEAEVSALREALKIALGEVASRDQDIEVLRGEVLHNRRASSELHHRLKNSFQLLCCALQLQEQSVRNNQAACVIADARLRITAIGRVHASLVADGKPATVNFRNYVIDLCDAIGASLGLRCDVSAEECDLDIGTATSVGIIVNELVVNVAKHAMPTTGGDAVLRIQASRDAEGALIVVVSDSGPGLPPTFVIDNSTSLGLRIVRSTVKETGGTLSIDQDAGAVFTIRIPPIAGVSNAVMPR